MKIETGSRLFYLDKANKGIEMIMPYLEMMETQEKVATLKEYLTQEMKLYKADLDAGENVDGWIKKPSDK